MGADPRVRLIEIGERLDRLEAEVAALVRRVAEIERLLLAVTRANAGKGERRVGA